MVAPFVSALFSAKVFVLGLHVGKASRIDSLVLVEIFNRAAAMPLFDNYIHLPRCGMLATVLRCRLFGQKVAFWFLMREVPDSILLMADFSYLLTKSILKAVAAVVALQKCGL